MHIPDGYLSPATAGTMYVIAMPFWYTASRRVQQTLTQRTVPMLALFSAFSFVLMMFNIPLPGGTTGHAVGGTLLAIVLGPWAAMLGITVVLIVQAFMFGDGGVLALGANCFNMAIALPLTGYFVYKVLGAGSDASSPRRLIGAVVGSYTGIAIAAFLTALELGLQPHFFHTVDGTPLYSPYGLGTAMAAMMGGHLLVAGPVEALATGLIFAYLQHSHSSLIGAEAPGKKEGRIWILWGVLALLIFAVPVGLLSSGTAWGEWSSDQLTSRGLGFIPTGLQQFESWWPAPISDYGPARVGEAIGYILSAIVGVALVLFLAWLLARRLARKSGASRERIKSRPGSSTARGEGFLVKNISGFTRVLESLIFTEDIARTHGFLQGLDARVKMVTFLLFMIMVSLSRSLPVLGILSGSILALVLLSRIPFRPFLKRVLFFIPIFTGVIALPALFITRGDPLVTAGSQVIITEQGARTAGMLLLRVTDSLSLAILLILSTPWVRLLAVLRWLRLPPIFVAILSMTYRYIFLLLHTTNNMFLARRSRIFGSLSGRENRRWLGRTLTTTLIKSNRLSEDVYLAMLSRGYQGDVIVMDSFSIQRRDFVWGICTLVAISLFLWVNGI